jgi:hypothetical protein
VSASSPRLRQNRRPSELAIRERRAEKSILVGYQLSAISFQLKYLQ